jgi:hypothetical protein
MCAMQRQGLWTRSAHEAHLRHESSEAPERPTGCIVRVLPGPQDPAAAYPRPRTHLATIQRQGRWKPDAFWLYVRDNIADRAVEVVRAFSLAQESGLETSATQNILTWPPGAALSLRGGEPTSVSSLRASIALLRGDIWFLFSLHTHTHRTSSDAFPQQLRRFPTKQLYREA